MTHSAVASCNVFLFLTHFDVICDQLLTRHTAAWNIIKKQKNVDDSPLFPRSQVIINQNARILRMIRHINISLILAQTPPYLILFEIFCHYYSFHKSEWMFHFYKPSWCFTKVAANFVWLSYLWAGNGVRLRFSYGKKCCWCSIAPTGAPTQKFISKVFPW